MKSIEEIRKGLEKHMNSALPCKGNCPYYQPNGYGSCAERLYDDVYEFVFHTEKYYPPKEEKE